MIGSVKLYIGIDLGGTNLKAGMVDSQGEVLYTVTKVTQLEFGWQKVVADMADQINQLLFLSKKRLTEIESIGIGVPGTVDYKNGVVLYCTNLKWHNVPIVSELKKYFNKRILVENDANAAGYAECILGVSEGLANSVFLTLGTGIGSGIVINGEIYRGSHSSGAEIGHMIVGENFYNCNCGKNGVFRDFFFCNGFNEILQSLSQRSKK